MGQTKVDLHHLLEDLRDAYPDSPEETILSEIVANSLDSGAKRISLETAPAAGTFTAVDDGSGMQRRALARYHDLASSSKTRGEGIGFAGVGIKLALLFSHEVYTETRRGETHVATRWSLSSRHKAPWKWAPPLGLVAERGTAVRFELSNVLSPLLDVGFVEQALRRHFETLFDPTFDAFLSSRYDRPVTFELNGATLYRRPVASGRVEPLEIRLARRRKPSAIGHIALANVPLPEEERGIAISTLGKVIKRGWDWIGVSPAAHDRISGLIEAPELAACLTLNKSDFIRSGSRGAVYLGFRKAFQEIVSRQVALWGDANKGSADEKRKVARPVERDLERVLVDLAERFPLLAALVEHRSGGQRKLPLGGGRSERDAAGWAGGTGTPAPQDGGHPGDDPSPPVAPDGVDAPTPPEPEGPKPESQPPGAASPLQLPSPRGPKRPQRYGLQLRFESRPDEPDLGRLIDSIVWVNEAHAAYRRAAASRSEGYHLALTVAMALASLAVEAPQERRFVESFLATWGEEVASKKPRKRPRSANPGGGAR